MGNLGGLDGGWGLGLDGKWHISSQDTPGFRVEGLGFKGLRV